MNGFLAIVARDLRMALRQGGDSAMVVVFFIVAVSLFPLGVGPEPGMLAKMSVGVVWVAALLAAMLSLERLFQTDYEDGTLELLALSSQPLELAVLAKALTHWLTTGLPLMIASPLLAVMMQMEATGFGALLATMAIGTPCLSLIGAVGAALILGARRGGVLLSLLVLPLYIPVLIFGAGAVEAAVLGFDFGVHLQLLGAILLVALPVAPFTAGRALRAALE